MAVTWTQAEIDELKAAIATGIMTVKYSGPPAREIQYQSLEAMRSLLAEMCAQVGGTTAFRRAAHNKGFR